MCGLLKHQWADFAESTPRSRQVIAEELIRSRSAYSIFPMQSQYERFPGVWELESRNAGLPTWQTGPACNLCIEVHGDGLRFTLGGDDPDSKPMHHVYGGLIDERMFQ